MGLLKKLLHPNPKKNIGAEGLDSNFKNKMEAAIRNPKDNLDSLTYKPPRPNPMFEKEIPPTSGRSAALLPLNVHVPITRKVFSGPQNLLNDDREQYAIGGVVSAITKGITKLIAKVKKNASKRRTKKQDSKDIVELRTTLKEFDAYDNVLQRKIADDPVNTDYTEQMELLQEARFYVESELKQRSRTQVAEGGSLLADDMPMDDMPMDDMPMDDMPMDDMPMDDMPMDDIPVGETHMMPDGTEMPGATHEESEMMMESVEPEMDPDSEMEKEFLDFILDEALSDEEEQLLLSKIEQDEELSMLFDKVMDVAQEFAGSGPVEGPGSGVSDSIPARLSDGEFVFTTAAVEEIGADNLMAMMKDAEMKAEERQGLAEGGEPEERVELPVKEQKEPQVRIVKKTVDSPRGLLDEDEISKGIKSKMMLDPDQRHVRS